MLEEVSSTTREATLTSLLNKGEATAAELASGLEISVQAMRRHLRILEEEGLVQANAISIGPGRPLNVWQLTSDGHSSFFNGSENFALDLLETLNGNLPEDKIGELFEKQAFNKANCYRQKIGDGTISSRLERLVQLRKEDGYISKLQQSTDGSNWYLTEVTCSIMSIATKYPTLCDQELKMIRYILPDCEVKRVQWRLEYGHSCGFEITPINTDV